MYVLLVVFHASMYFSIQDERQVCSFEESDVDGLGMQVAKQFLEFGGVWWLADIAHMWEGGGHRVH
jgi:hypothetical protein